MPSHEEFVELCALSLSDELTSDERRRLDEHLQGCAACREALAQFKASVRATVPVATEQSEPEESDPSFSVENAETAFFSRFDREGGFDSLEERRHATGKAFASGAGWGQLWMPFVAILLLCIALGVASYRIGMKKGAETANLVSPADCGQVGLEARLTDAGRERQELVAQIAARDNAITELRNQIQEQSASLQPQRPLASTDQNDSAAQAANIARLEALREQLEAEEEARSQDTARITELEAKVADLSKQLQESGLTIAQQKQRLDEEESALRQERDLLEHDRDIRDLMGARQLHVVDVYDVGGGGTNKPYGRVFYTQGKSLIFYAYDLDQASGVRRASTFQAWGRRGPNKDRALNLGVFYEDNAANKRWVVKFDDPKSLAQIDGVFVTIEPDAQSNIPRGKQVLFAYLNVEPNHP